MQTLNNFHFTNQAELFFTLMHNLFKHYAIQIQHKWSEEKPSQNPFSKHSDSDDDVDGVPGKCQ